MGIQINSSVPHHHEICSTLHHCDVHLIAHPDKDFAQLNICEPQKQPCDKGELLVMLASYLEPSFQTNLASRSQPRHGVYPYTIPIHTQVRWLQSRSEITHSKPQSSGRTRAESTSHDPRSDWPQKASRNSVLCQVSHTIQFLLAKTNVHFPNQKKMTEIIRSFFGGPQQLSCPVKPKNRRLSLGILGTFRHTLPYPRFSQILRIWPFVLCPRWPEATRDVGAHVNFHNPCFFAKCIWVSNQM